jgi:enolase-phosphatase E1
LKAYLLDIEGTTTPIDFVTKTLFPFARRELRSFLSQGDALLAQDREWLREEHAQETEAPPWSEDLEPYLLWLMDRDRKSRGLKSIQGRIWAEGYRSGKLKGEVYADVHPAFERWKATGAGIYIYSSGSVLAQKLIFGHLDPYPLTPLIDGYFDTEVGPKRSPGSYRKIAAQIGLPPHDILFLSDVIEEVIAAREAGMQARQVCRPGTDAKDDSPVSDFESV